MNQWTRQEIRDESGVYISHLSFLSWLLVARYFDDFLFFHPRAANRHCGIHLGGITLVSTLVDSRRHVFTNGQGDAVLCPGDYLAGGAVIIQTIGYNELKSNVGVDLTSGESLPSHYGFPRQRMLFVRWTIPSSHRDAARLVSTPSHLWAWLGISISQPSPNLSSFHLTVTDQIGKVFTVLKSEDVTVVLLSRSSICSGLTAIQRLMLGSTLFWSRIFLALMSLAIVKPAEP